eukprot:9377791-Pyramimonas_sp.AAC.1
MSPSSFCCKGCANYTWQERTISSQGGTIENEKGGYRGLENYILIGTRAYEIEQPQKGLFIL